MVLLFAVLFQYLCGSRSFDSLNKSHIIDGAYRVYTGQVPFRDFYSPVGPVEFWLLALFYRVFGITNMAGVALSCAMNGLAAGLVMSISWREWRDSWIMSAAGLATAVWFIPLDPDAPGYNTVAFLFLFIALGFLLNGFKDRNARWAWGLAGAAVALAFYGKQSIGAVGGLGLALYAARDGERRERAAWFISGLAAGLLILTVHVGLVDWPNFARYFLELPLGYDKLHHHMPPGNLIRHLQSPLIILLPLAALSFMSNARDRALLTALTLIQFSACLLSTGWAYLYLPFIGLQWGLAAAGWRDRADMPGSFPIAASWTLLMLLGMRHSLSQFMPELLAFPALEASVGIILLSLSLLGLRDGARRVYASIGLAAGLLVLVHAALYYRLRERPAGGSQERMFRSVRVKFLKGLQVRTVEAGEIEEVVSYLENLPAEGKPFFADIPLFHAMLGQPSPQPFVWFLKGLTHREGEPDESRLCGSLRRNDVRTIVTVQESAVTVGSLECLKRWIESDFYLDRAIGEYVVHRRRARPRAEYPNPARRSG